MNRLPKLLVLALLLLPLSAWADTTWDFTQTPEADWTALGSDAANWAAKSDTRYSNLNKLSAQPLTANGSELSMTRGLKFTCSSADKIRIDRDNRIALNGKGIVVTIPSLTQGQTVTVTYASANASQERGLTTTNLADASTSTTDKTDFTSTVTASGDVTLTTTAGVSIYKIVVTGSGSTPDTPPSTKTDVTAHATARNSQASQALVTNSNSELKYYNTADITKIDIDADTLYINGSGWQDIYYAPRNLAFSKATGGGSGGEVVNEDGKVVITEAKGWMESAYVKFKRLGSYTGYHVYIKGEDYTSWTRLDSMLVRSYGDSLRADMVGLHPGTYALRVVPVSQGTELTAGANEATGLVVTAYDRSGFAHLNHEGVGAYNDDGTLKSGARVIYVTAETAKTVTLPVKMSAKDGDGTTRTGLQAILDAYQKGYETRPLDVRFIGLISLSDLDAISSSAEGLQVKGKNDYSAMNMTFEGIGDDATVKGFGFLIRNSTDVEFRNFAIMRCMDDALSFDTSNRYIWVHNMDFFYGKGGSGDHAKGDGTVDLKDDTQYVTVAYNHFFDTGKNSLCGMKSESGPNYICYHHNWFDHSDSRNPRVRTMSVHVWNNYFDGVAKYGVGATTGSSVFVESNYFRATHDPMLISQQGTDAKGGGTFSGETGGLIKSYGNVYADKGSSSNYTPITQQQSATSFDCYEVSARDEQVPATVKALVGGTGYDNFDTDDKLMYTYTPDDATAVPAVVTGWTGAGRLAKGDFHWAFTSADDSDYGVNSALATAIDAYQTKLVAIAK